MNTYFGEINEQQFDQLITKTFPHCSNCGKPMIYCCIEKICQKTEMICDNCQQIYGCKLHLSHQIVDLKYICQVNEDLNEHQQNFVENYDQLLQQLKQIGSNHQRRLSQLQNNIVRHQYRLEEIRTIIKTIQLKRKYFKQRSEQKQMLDKAIKELIKKSIDNCDIVGNLNNMIELIRRFNQFEYSKTFVLQQRQLLKQIEQTIQYQQQIGYCKEIIDSFHDYLNNINQSMSLIREQKYYRQQKYILKGCTIEIQQGCSELCLQFKNNPRCKFSQLPKSLRVFSIDGNVNLNNKLDFLKNLNLQEFHLQISHNQYFCSKQFLSDCIKLNLRSLTFSIDFNKFGLNHFRLLRRTKLQIKQMHLIIVFRGKRHIRQQILQILAFERY